MGSIGGGTKNLVDVDATYTSISGGFNNLAAGNSSSLLGGLGRSLLAGVTGRSQAGATVFAP